jgi:undecaprenyl-diphosphatase
VETLAAWDRALFHWINHSWANPILDRVFPALTDFSHWRIPVVIACLLLLLVGRTRGRVTVLMVVAGIALSDQTAAHLIKPLVDRVRPCNALDGVRLLIPASGAPSFPSAHAANITAAAILLSARYNRLKWAWISVAVLVCLSRVYVGVHYPLDVLGGAAVGACMAGVVLGARRWIAGRTARSGTGSGAPEGPGPGERGSEETS